MTGSANLLLLEQIGQSLAGRTAVLTLLPFSLAELAKGGHAFEQPEAAIFAGQYPPIYDRQIAPTDFYPAYLQTTVERDVRLLKNITGLNAFIQFTQLCAGGSLSGTARPTSCWNRLKKSNANTAGDAKKACRNSGAGGADRRSATAQTDNIRAGNS